MTACRQALLFASILSCVLSTGNNTQVVRWYVPGNGQLESVTTPLNGSVTFSWTSTHDLWEIPTLSCPETFANGSGISQLAAQSSGGSRTVQFPTAGTRYFSCSVSDHCEDGQLIAVRVGSASPAPAPGPRSRYGKSYGGGRTCGGNSTSGSGYGGSSGSGSNYAGAPGTSNYGGGSNSTYGGDKSTYGGGNSEYGGGNSTYGGGNSTYGGGNSTYGGGNSTYGGGGAGYAGGSSSNYGAASESG